MRIKKTPKQIPDGLPSSSPAPASGLSVSDDQEQYVWEVLAPRLLQPSKLAFIQALLERRQPLGLRELAKAADITDEHAGYQCKSMQRAGVLEVVSVASSTGGDEEEPSYYFTKPTASFSTGQQSPPASEPGN